MYKFLAWLAVLLWMFLIFFMSSQVATQSNELSTGVTEIVVNTLKKVSPNINIDIKAFNHIVRKNAHFISYLILGILTSRAFKHSKVSSFSFYAFILCVVYATSDEIHQLFVPGRGAQVTDVFIDSIGSLTGIVLYLCFIYTFKKGKRA